MTLIQKTYNLNHINIDQYKKCECVETITTPEKDKIDVKRSTYWRNKVSTIKRVI